MNNCPHPLADVQTKQIGKNSFIAPYCIVLKNAIIGKNCNIGSHCFIENNVLIGDNVNISAGVHIWDGTVIEDNVFIGPNVTLTNDKYPKSKNKNFKLESLTIKEGAIIGAGAVILPGITIGNGSIIEPYSVVTKDVKPLSTISGNPAKNISKRTS